MKDDTYVALREACAELVRVASVIREETDDIVAAADHIPLIRHFNTIRKVNEDIKSAKSALTDIEDALSVTHIPDLLAHLKDTIGLKTPINLEGVGRITVSYRFSCSMLDKEQGIAWLDANGHGDLAIRTVNSGSLSSFAKRMIEVEGKELPDDLFKTGTKPYTSITKN